MGRICAGVSPSSGLLPDRIFCMRDLYFSKSCRVRSESGPRFCSWHQVTNRSNSFVYALQVCLERLVRSRKNADSAA